MSKRKKSVLLLVGPTAVGKTDISVELAHHIDAEIISADSMQVYQGMDIFTAKPTAEQRKKIAHYLIDVLSPEKEYNVSVFREMALEAIRKIHSKNKVPLVVGGSGMYVKVLLDGIFPSVEKDAAFRQNLEKIADTNGAEFLYRQLEEIDPDICRVIHKNDTRRIVRALEVYDITGEKMSDIQKKKTGLEIEYDIKIFGLMRARNTLYERIDARVDEMFKQGLIEAVKKLSKVNLSISAKQALGYKEIIDYLDGKIALQEANRLIKRNSRHFAKRQLTWFKKDKRISWIDIDGLNSKEVVGCIVRLIV